MNFALSEFAMLLLAYVATGFYLDEFFTFPEDEFYELPRADMVGGSYVDDSYNKWKADRLVWRNSLEKPSILRRSVSEKSLDFISNIIAKDYSSNIPLPLSLLIKCLWKIWIDDKTFPSEVALKEMEMTELFEYDEPPEDWTS